MLQIEISALPTVRVVAEFAGDTPGIEPAITGVAAPRPEAEKSAKEVKNPVAVGAEAV